MPPTIIIIEDEQETADMLAEMVRLCGYEVVQAPLGMRAIAVIAKRLPAAVLLDIIMPELSGFEILHLMRRDPRLAKIPVIIVSAKSMPADIRAGLEAGIVSYLIKPVVIGEVKEAVEKAIHLYNESI